MNRLFLFAALVANQRNHLWVGVVAHLVLSLSDIADWGIHNLPRLCISMDVGQCITLYLYTGVYVSEHLHELKRYSTDSTILQEIEPLKLEPWWIVQYQLKPQWMYLFHFKLKVVRLLKSFTLRFLTWIHHSYYTSLHFESRLWNFAIITCSMWYIKRSVEKDVFIEWIGNFTRGITILIPSMSLMMIFPFVKSCSW